MTNVIAVVAVSSGFALLFQLSRLPDVLRDATSGSSLGLVFVTVGVGLAWLGRVRRREMRSRSVAGLARPVIVRSTQATKGGVT